MPAARAAGPSSWKDVLHGRLDRLLSVGSGAVLESARRLGVHAQQARRSHVCATAPSQRGCPHGPHQRSAGRPPYAPRASGRSDSDAPYPRARPRAPPSDASQGASPPPPCAPSATATTLPCADSLRTPRPLSCAPPRACDPRRTGPARRGSSGTRRRPPDSPPPSRHRASHLHQSSRAEAATRPADGPASLPTTLQVAPCLRLYALELHSLPALPRRSTLPRLPPHSAADPPRGQARAAARLLPLPQQLELPLHLEQPLRALHVALERVRSGSGSSAGGVNHCGSTSTAQAKIGPCAA